MVLIQTFIASILYWLCWSLGFFVYHTPFFVKQKYAKALAWIWFYILPFRVRTILHNLILVFPRESEESMRDWQKRLESLAKKNLQHQALMLVEIFERFHFKPSDYGKRFVLEGLENVQDLLSKKQGCFFLTAHLGNWELMTLTGVQAGIPLVILTKFLRNPFFDQLWVRSRKQFGLELLQERGSGHAMVKTIRKGKCVGFILDQHTGEPHGVLSQFLGQAAWTAKGLAILSTRLNAPVVPAHVFRDAQGRHITRMEAPLEFRNESLNSEDEKISFHILQCNRKMESWIRACPEQYLWMHRRFKNLIDYRSSLAWDSNS